MKKNLQSEISKIVNQYENDNYVPEGVTGENLVDAIFTLIKKHEREVIEEDRVRLKKVLQEGFTPDIEEAVFEELAKLNDPNGPKEVEK